MYNKLEPSKVNSWTTEQCLAVYNSLEYLGMGDWHSDLCSDYLDSEQIETLNWSLAQAYADLKNQEAEKMQQGHENRE